MKYGRQGNGKMSGKRKERRDIYGEDREKRKQRYDLSQRRRRLEEEDEEDATFVDDDYVPSWDREDARGGDEDERDDDRNDESDESECSDEDDEES